MSNLSFTLTRATNLSAKNVARYQMSADQHTKPSYHGVNSFRCTVKPGQVVS